MDLEQIIRPFAYRPVISRNKITVVPPETSDNCVLTIGANGGKVKTVNGSLNVTKTYYCDSKAKVTPKKVVTQRIKNPDDEEQYVDVKVMDKMQVVSGGGQDYQKTTHQTDYSQLNADAEIINVETFD